MGLVNQYAQKITKGNKIAGIIISIVLILMGILLLIAPLRALIAFEYLAAAAFIVVGLIRIIFYCKTPKENRNSMVLINAICLLVVGLLLIFRGPLAVAESFAFLFGFVSMFNGIGKFCSLGLVKEAGGSTGLAVLSGIIDILAALFFLSAPFISQWAFGILVSVYLLVGGLTMLIESLSMSGK